MGVGGFCVEKFVLGWGDGWFLKCVDIGPWGAYDRAFR